MEPGKRLRSIREQLGLSFRDVLTASERIAEKRQNKAFCIPPSRLFDIENKEVVPSVYRFYSLAAIYRKNISELFCFYDICVDEITSDLSVVEPPHTHRIEGLDFIQKLTVPLLGDSVFDPRKTQNLGQLIREWGVVPFSFLSQFATVQFTYGYIGTADFTMSPMLPPGSFIQVDESRNRLIEKPWKSELHRPIYFIETRTGFRCGWCSLSEGRLVLQPHPLSPESVRIYRYPQEAEIIGEVVGAAIRLQDR